MVFGADKYAYAYVRKKRKQYNTLKIYQPLIERI